MIIDIEHGKIIVRAPDELTGLTENDAHVTPDQARAVARGLDIDGHPVAAEGLRRAAAQAEKGR